MLVIFDCDGVLVDSEPLSNRILAERLTAIGLPTTTEGSIRDYMGRSWASCEALIEARLGRYDMVLNQSGRPHGFRNDGVGPVLMSISVGSGSPKPPVYSCHPRDGDPARARRFGALPGRTIAFDADGDDPRHREFARHIVRHADCRPTWQAGLARLDYIGGIGAPAGGYQMEMIHLPRGVAVRGYQRAVEEVYFVLDGVVTVGWEDDRDAAEQRLGCRDVIRTPPGRTRHFRNDGIADATFMLLSGAVSEQQDIPFEAA